MGVAVGVAKQVIIKKESQWGVAAPGSGGQLLRRVTSTLALNKATYQSNELNNHYQVADFRHGVRSVGGAIDGELSPGTYQLLWAAAMRKAFVALGSTTSQNTISAQANAPQFSRSGGSFLTDGHKVGDVVRFTGWTTGGASNNSKNFLISALTGTTMTGLFLDGSAVAAKSAGDSVSISAPGKKAYTPISGHTDDSFNIEEWYSDITQSELYLGNKVSQIDVSLPATGMATVKFTFMGKDMSGGATQQLTTPNAATTTGVFAAVNGAVVLNGAQIALITGLNFTINGTMSAEPVVGSNTYPDVFEGPVVVTGQATVFFQDAVARDYFINETEVSLTAAFTTGNTGTADFMSFTFPRVKMGGAAKNDGPKGLVMTMPFTALLAATGGSGIANEQSTLVIQDSQAA